MRIALVHEGGPIALSRRVLCWAEVTIFTPCKPPEWCGVGGRWEGSEFPRQRSLGPTIFWREGARDLHWSYLCSYNKCPDLFILSISGGSWDGGVPVEVGEGNERPPKAITCAMSGLSWRRYGIFSPEGRGGISKTGVQGSECIRQRDLVGAGGLQGKGDWKERGQEEGPLLTEDPSLLTVELLPFSHVLCFLPPHCPAFQRPWPWKHLWLACPHLTIHLPGGLWCLIVCVNLARPWYLGEHYPGYFCECVFLMRLTFKLWTLSKADCPP